MSFSSFLSVVNSLAQRDLDACHAKILCKSDCCLHSSQMSHFSCELTRLDDSDFSSLKFAAKKQKVHRSLMFSILVNLYEEMSFISRYQVM